MIVIPETLKIEPLPSAIFRDRPENCAIDTVIIHSMYNDRSENWASVTECKKLLDFHDVSAHFMIDRDGYVYQMVPVEKRARHAGQSLMPLKEDGRIDVNDFSIGIELVAREDTGYTSAQMIAIAALISHLSFEFPLNSIYGHSDIAPGRKTDPHLFDWQELKELLYERGVLSRIKNFRQLEGV